MEKVKCSKCTTVFEMTEDQIDETMEKYDGVLFCPDCQETLYEQCEEAIGELESIAEKICQLSDEAQNIVREILPHNMSSYDAYVFNQLSESVDNCNPYNQSIRTIIKDIEKLKG